MRSRSNWRWKASRSTTLIPVGMMFVDTDEDTIPDTWVADTDPASVASPDGYWVDNPDYPATSDSPFVIDDTAVEGYPAYLLNGRLVIDVGDFVGVEPPDYRAQEDGVLRVLEDGTNRILEAA